MNPLSTKPTYLNYRASSSGTGIPSGIRTSSPSTSASAPMLNRLPSANSTLSSNPNGSSIILYVPNIASSALSQHLSVLLSTHRIAAVHLIGGRDVILRNLRTEIYTLAGRMRSDVQVSISVTENAKGLEIAVRDIGARKQKVLGALVCECDEQSEEGEQEKDILTLETDELDAIWKTSVLPLHTLLRSLLPLFADTTTATTTAHPSAMPFIYLDTPSHLSTFATTSRAALLSSLTSSPATKNITIGPAAEYLVPAPVLSETQSMRSLQIDTSNGNGYSATTPETSPLFSAESPTKLWASWAAQYE
ncbi:hypothetical protein E4T42_03467 [Aureobasidium subglaciale]|uniref:Uncharacterized protein n=1 Tax=Aureobasidium subglaciale (strain EXF-2481) TaxID=1043005 RepID=A0A074YCR2_AURSE|nr:uncharacterized protein AUEXF2481DRAFT_6404 [Aureobasidium subglaciale EXF-2481]KAI5208880.1 hypothetical protein E4T38_02663 [Aureobasidium subglaciale]KAI5227620.1 hypothetical protein E4T40_02512 [Aureobasidium subglaciale]KAI5231005.1 hypothetical protein E4T41_02662 [Aureobasidium subglaciale]KAI5252372.1 hypothetical protein E4T42_03467 [Aureobasidium subglaciale]KAI5265134.1 hypothetical protein E4T46_02440 [Aureobasidium subglaciale]